VPAVSSIVVQESAVLQGLETQQVSVASQIFEPKHPSLKMPPFKPPKRKKKAVPRKKKAKVKRKSKMGKREYLYPVATASEATKFMLSGMNNGRKPKKR